MEYMESKMQDLIEGGINERDSLYAEIAALRAQVAEAKESERRQFELDGLRVLELQAKLTDCQAVLKSRGHEWNCPAVMCVKCGSHQTASWHEEANDPNDWCIFEPKDACSDACGYERCTGGGGK